MNHPHTLGQRLLLLLGSLGPLGRLPASGSIAVAVIGVPLYWLTRSMSPVWYLALLAAFTVLAAWMHGAGDQLLGEKDSRKLVWDELVGFMLAVAFLPFTWWLAIIAFFVERVIDIVKVPPANWIERHWPGGLGVVGDDIVAGIYSAVALHLLVYLAPSLGGAA